MNLFKTEATLELHPVQQFDGEVWRPTKLRTDGGSIILTDVTDAEHDALVDFHQNSDPGGLRGIVVSLHLEDQNENDPEQVNLLALPSQNSVIRHMDQYYLVKLVVQGTNCSAAVFAARLTASDFWKLTGSAALRV